MPALDLRNHEHLDLVAALERHKHPESQKLHKKYSNLAEHMFTNVLKDIDLAMYIREGTLFTIHGTSHILEVIDNIGRLLGPKIKKLSPRDIYVLLCAAILHDYGNIDDRIDHNKKPSEFLDAHEDLFDEDFELRRGILQIAEAHGGKARDGGPDTIADITLGQHHKSLAATLRLADELADNSNRTYKTLYEKGMIPAISKEHHQYCRSIQSVKIADFNIELSLIFDEEDFPSKFIVARDLSFMHYVDRRLAKTQMELRLASRYLPPLIQRLSASVELGLFETGSRNCIRKSITLPFDDDLESDCFFQRCSTLLQKGIGGHDAFGKWLLGGTS